MKKETLVQLYFCKFILFIVHAAQLSQKYQCLRCSCNSIVLHPAQRNGKFKKKKPNKQTKNKKKAEKLFLIQLKAFLQVVHILERVDYSVKFGFYKWFNDCLNITLHKIQRQERSRKFCLRYDWT